MSNFLQSTITKLPATAAKGETVETLNEKREAARKAQDRVLAAEKRGAELDEMEEREEECDIAFDIYNNAYYNHNKVPGSMDKLEDIRAYYL